MKVKFKSKKLQKECTDYSITKKVYGEKMAIKIHHSLDTISAANSIEILVRGNIGRCHPLIGDRNGEYAMELVQPFRLCFKKHIIEAETVIVISIENYH